MGTLLYVLANIFRLYVLYDISKPHFGERKVSRIKVFTAYVGFYAVNTGAELLLHNPVLNILTNILPLFLISLLYSGKIFRKSIAVIIIFSVAMFLDSILFAFISYFKLSSVIISSGMAISLLLYFIDLVLKSTVQKPKFITLPIKISYYLSIFFIPLGSMVIGYFIIIKLDFISILTSLFLLILNVVVFYLYNGVMQLYSQEYEKQILLQFAQSYRKEIEMLTETNKNISMLKHDMKNHLNHIFTLSEKNENDKIQKYIRRTESFITNTYQIAQSENEDFNSILNYKLYNAKEMGIEVSLELSVPNSINMEAFDITVILGNLLDNAIENANVSDKKQISVSIFCLKGVLNISISNSYNKQSFDNFNTTKKNKEMHGLGLKIIEMFVTKYKGVFEKKIEGDFVVIKCILFV